MSRRKPWQSRSHGRRVVASALVAVVAILLAMLTPGWVSADESTAPESSSSEVAQPTSDSTTSSEVAAEPPAEQEPPAPAPDPEPEPVKEDPPPEQAADPNPDRGPPPAEQAPADQPDAQQQAPEPAPAPDPEPEPAPKPEVAEAPTTFQEVIEQLAVEATYDSGAIPGCAGFIEGYLTIVGDMPGDSEGAVLGYSDSSQTTLLHSEVTSQGNTTLETTFPEGVFSVRVQVGEGGQHYAQTYNWTEPAECLPPPTKTIAAKALSDHECDSSEWHFVITQVDDEANAPASITVTWANGQSASVPLDKVTGGTAHYATTQHLDSTVTAATAVIYEDWDGQFNLSHGPCPVVTTSTSATPTTETVVTTSSTETTSSSSTSSSETSTSETETSATSSSTESTVTSTSDSSTSTSSSTTDSTTSTSATTEPPLECPPGTTKIQYDGGTGCEPNLTVVAECGKVLVTNGSPYTLYVLFGDRSVAPDGFIEIPPGATGEIPTTRTVLDLLAFAVEDPSLLPNEENDVVVEQGCEPPPTTTTETVVTTSTVTAPTTATETVVSVPPVVTVTAAPSQPAVVVWVPPVKHHHDDHVAPVAALVTNPSANVEGGPEDIVPGSGADLGRLMMIIALVGVLVIGLVVLGRRQGWRLFQSYQRQH